MTDSWAILRTGSRSTLKLAASLTADGIEAWSPRLVMDRKPKQTMFPSRRQYAQRAIPITPRYVFARSGHLAELHALAQCRGRHAEFSIIYSFGRPGLVADCLLEPFRSAEVGCTAKARQCGFELGRAVRVAEGIAAGMEGTVESSNWRTTRVGFKDGRPMKFDTSILREIMSQGREAA